MSFFTDQEVAELRELSESAMDVTATLRSPSTSTFDDATGRRSWSPGAERFSGDIAVRPLSPGRTIQAGEQELPFRQARTHFPRTAPIALIDDVLTIDACARNPQLVGEKFRVTGVSFDSDLVSWEVTIEHTAGSSTTPE